MAKKPTITTVSAGFASNTQLNDNFAALRDAFDNTLSRDGSTPNAMGADLDMNNNDILNAGEVDVQGLTISGVQVFPANTQIATTYATQNYTGNGSTTVYAMGFNPGIKANVDVYIDGVYQNQDAFSISGTNLTFTAAPPLNSAIEIKVPVNVTSLVNTDSSQVVYNQGGTGAQDRSVQSRLRDFVSVKDFGAVGDGVTDDTAAIQAAADYCEANGAFLYGAPGTYLITSTVTLECSGDLSQMQINADGSSFSPAIQVGPASAANYLFDADLKLPFVTNTAKTGTGWSGFDTSIGVLCANVYQSRITVPSVYNFGVGLKVGGYSVGNVYNTYNIGVLFNNKINLQCKPGDANGWSNQNTFIGGRYGYSSAEGTAVSGVIQIQLRDFDATGPNAPNTNVWLNPSVEGNEPEFHFDIQGFANTIISPRLEMVGGASARINFHAVTTNETTSNNFIGGYKFAVVYTFSGAGTSVNNGYIASRGSDTFDFSGSGYNVRNTSGNSISAPHFQGFPSSVQPLPKDNTATDWTYRIFGEGFAVKATGNTQPRVQIDASGYVFFGTGAAALAGGLRYNVTPAAITSNIAFAPDSDNNLTLGTASRRWSEVFAGTPTINVSDGTLKTDVEEITDAERRVALTLKGKLRKFKFKDAVEAKDDAARIHFGIIAQDVAAAFEAEGLSAERYGVFCSDTWMEEDGTEVTRLGVRYEELMAFILAAI